MILGSSKAVKDALAKRFGQLSRARHIPLQSWGKKLGIQYTMGSRRLATIVKARFAKANQRTSRVSRLRRVVNRRQRHRLYNTAVRPTATYGAAYWGVPDSYIRALRRQVSNVHGQPSRFRSTTLLCALGAEGLVDPAYQAHALPILAWARTIWLGRKSLADLDAVLDWSMTRSAEHSEPWRYVTGPG